IAWICALHVELETSRLMLDNEHEPLPARDGDDNSYILGHILQHNIAMTALPGIYGKVNAANVARDLKRSFPNIRATLLVGIGGGAPTEADLYLGDVVIGTRVMEYDLGKALDYGGFEITAIPKQPAAFVLSAVTNLRSKHGPGRVSPRSMEILRTRLSRYPRPQLPDHLFRAGYSHLSDTTKTCCVDCDMTQLQPRRRRLTDDFFIHYGGVASGDSVNRDAAKRDAIARKLEIKCFEMEAAGIMDSFACLPIRGICDYSDSHKNKEWQSYAAATAASYARELLETIPPLAGTHQGPPLPSGSGEDEARRKNQSLVAERQRRFLELLDFPQSGRRRDAIQPEQIKTCLWFLSHKKYLEWADLKTQDPGRSSLLWLRGKAGAGKSTMMKFIYREAVKNGLADVAISFFFSARGDYLERSIEGMYRSLLKQVLVALPSVYAALYASKSFAADRAVCPSLSSLKFLLRDAVMSLSKQSLVCFIDALDECNEDDVRDMVQFLEDITDLASAEGIQFRVAFSSRPYPYIYVRENLLVTLENEEGHAEDLTQYVRRCLKVPGSLQAELEKEVLEKARGIFLWVELTVKILNKESPYGPLALRRRLSEIPPTLSQLFRDILTRDNERPEELRRCIMWILCARRPLDVWEFHMAMWAGEFAHGAVDEDLASIESEQEIHGLVSSCSKGLVEVVHTGRTSQRHSRGWQDSSTVQFIHESVRDYLIKERGIMDIWPDLGFEWQGVVHDKLRGCCEAYLTHPSIRSHSRYREILQRGEGLDGGWDQLDREFAIAEANVFLEYATQNFLEHANQAAPFVAQEVHVNRFFECLGTPALDCCQHRHDRQYGLHAGTLYVLADRGLEDLIRYTQHDSATTAVDERLPYGHPLLAAVAGGHKGAVAALLGLPTIIYEGEDLLDGLERTTNPANLKTRTPVSWAAEEGRTTLVRLLAQKGYSTSERDRDGYTPLRSAICNGHVETVHLLADIEVAENKQAPVNMIGAAIAYGSEAMILSLLEKLESWDELKLSRSEVENWLRRARNRHHGEVIRVLTDRKATLAA
ncbi:uncharacterized protein B0I36DRAFT_238114, partial [Microdochium trichocladiopsis]